MFRVVTDACVSFVRLLYVRLGSTILFGPLDTPTETSGPHLWIYLSAMPHVVLLQPQKKTTSISATGGGGDYWVASATGGANRDCTYVKGLVYTNCGLPFFCFFRCAVRRCLVCESITEGNMRLLKSSLCLLSVPNSLAFGFRPPAAASAPSRLVCGTAGTGSNPNTIAVSFGFSVSCSATPLGGSRSHWPPTGGMTYPRARVLSHGFCVSVAASLQQSERERSCAQSVLIRVPAKPHQYPMCILEP